MASGERFGTIFDGGTTLGLGPSELLGRFRATRDEAAFAALVARHGPMVLATCRRILPERADADDAFQATFLVLAKKAASIRDPDRLAPWLHGVARRVATRSRSQAARRHAVEGERPEPGEADQEALAATPPPDDLFDLRRILDEELARLPAKYRAPLVLCYLEGLTHDEAADQLRWPVGTVRSRLAGGRDRLRGRLARRGFAPGVLAVLSPATLPVAAVSPVLQAATVRLVCTAAPVVVTSTAAALAQGALTSMFLAKIQPVAVVALAVTTALAAGTTGLVAQPQAAPVVAPAQVVPPPSNHDLAVQYATVKREADALAEQIEQIHHDAAAGLKPLEAQLAAKRVELAAVRDALGKRAGGMAGQPLPTPANPAPAAEPIRPPSLARIDYADPAKYLVLHRSFGDPDLIRRLAKPLQVGSAEETLDNIGRWISKTLKYDPNAAYEYRDVDAACQAKVYGGCADHALVFVALARACGIPAVFVKTMDVAWIREFRGTGTCKTWSGHVFLEVFLDDRWRLLDASAMQLYDDYTPTTRILPGNRYAYDKGSDPRELILSPDWERWKRQTAAYFGAFDLAQLPVGLGREVAAQDDVYIAADSPIWQAVTKRCQTLGYRVRLSFNMDYDATLPRTRGKHLIVTSVGDRVVPPAGAYGAYLPLTVAEIRERIDRNGAGVARQRLDDGTRIVLLYARDVAGLLKLVETWKLGASD